ncbi:MAG: hypothetical protein AB8B85_10405 [Paracoccaceae bacterium]
MASSDWINITADEMLGGHTQAQVDCAVRTDRRLHGTYRSWLYRTQAWSISFEEWKHRRIELVETLFA